MAIFSLNHSFVGRSTHAAGTAGASVRYNTRSEVCTTILGQRMPLDGKVYAWLDEQENSDRKNARVVDRVTVALPVELSRDQNIELLQDFGERMTQGRASWMAAIHDGPGDADNPHAHIIFRDRDIETGRRVMLTTEAGSTQRFRQAWEEEVNKALERAGLEERVDRRSLADQGIDREPEIHVGPGAHRLAERQHEFRSAEKQVTRLIRGAPTEVTVNYPVIDEGRTRFEENEARKLRNWVRAQEELALNGPTRPEDMPAMERIAQAGFRLDARYREAIRSGALPAEDGDPITTAIREQLGFREQGPIQDRKPGQQALNGEPLPPPLYYAPATENFGDNDEIKRRKDEFDKLKEQPGMEQMLRARDYLNALSFERGESAPTDKDVLAYMTWADANRVPLAREGRDRPGERRDPEGGEAGGSDPKERGPKRDAADLVAGAGLALVGRISDSLESLFDGRSAHQMERDEKMAGDKRTIEQITEEQQRRQEAEAAKWRQVELEQYLAQRDRERHIDRGR